MCRTCSERVRIVSVRGTNALYVFTDEVRGILKGWDPLVNLVLDDAVEEERGTTA